MKRKRELFWNTENGDFQLKGKNGAEKGKVPAFTKEEKFWRSEHNTNVISQVLMSTFCSIFLSTFGTSQIHSL